MIKLNQKGWWLCLLATAIVIVSCGSTGPDDEPEAYTKTITAINSETGEPMDGCRWRSGSEREEIGEYLEEDTCSITQTKKVDENVVYDVISKDGNWWGFKEITFDDNKPEEIVMEELDN